MSPGTVAQNQGKFRIHFNFPGRAVPDHDDHGYGPLATVVFYITVFVVSTGARLANISPSHDFSASLIVVAVILTGGLTPRMVRDGRPDAVSDDGDPTYG